MLRITPLSSCHRNLLALGALSSFLLVKKGHAPKFVRLAKLKGKRQSCGSINKPSGTTQNVDSIMFIAARKKPLVVCLVQSVRTGCTLKN